MRKFLRRFLLFSFVFLEILDFALTYVGLHRGFHEANPLAVYMIDHFGIVLGLLPLKAFAIWIGYIVTTRTDYYSPLVAINLVQLLVAIIPWILLLYVI